MKLIEAPPFPREAETMRRRVGAAVGGFCLICFFACTEILPFARHIGEVPRQATAHLAILLLPAGRASWSTLWFLIPAAVCAVFSARPFMWRGIQPGALLLCLGGMSFFGFAVLLPDATHVGFIWGLFGLTWMGANLWAWERDYLFGSMVALMLWDLGSGAQGIAYGMKALTEPYGAAIPPTTVVAVDCAGLVVVLGLWLLGVDFEEIWHRKVAPLLARGQGDTSAARGPS